MGSGQGPKKIGKSGANASRKTGSRFKKNLGGAGKTQAGRTRRGGERKRGKHKASAKNPRKTQNLTDETGKKCDVPAKGREQKKKPFQGKKGQTRH